LEIIAKKTKFAHIEEKTFPIREDITQWIGRPNSRDRRYSQLSLAHGTETRNEEKNKN